MEILLYFSLSSLASLHHLHTVLLFCLMDGYLLIIFLMHIIDSSFGINCGGPKFVSSSQVVYEREIEIDGMASYYVSDSETWAVSDVGYFPEINRNSSQYNRYNDTEHPIANTNDPDLFQTQELSTSSLRFYGLELKNGNYTVKLHFAEHAFADSSTWSSLGRRVFDINIQVIYFVFDDLSLF